jgi:hypothetical protein
MNMQESEIVDAVSHLNKLLSPFSFNIASAEYNRQSFYVLYNVKDDNAAKLGTGMNGSELDLFKKIVCLYCFLFELLFCS